MMRGRRESLLDRRGIDKRLERRARLAARLRRAVEAALIEAAASDHRAYFAGHRIHGDEGRLQRIGTGFHRRCAVSAAAARFPRSSGATSASAAFCMSRSMRRVDLQAALIDAVPAEALHELLADFFLECWP